ncbi:MAG: hypothetical protein GY853_11940 [PVC group bacterium]|nr:hypothetical protein [PVC group bacterium]
MDLAKLQDFFLWGLIINIAICIIQFLLCICLRGFVIKTHGKLFGLSEEAVSKAIYNYFGIYKIVINALFLAPWIAIQIIK